MDESKEIKGDTNKKSRNNPGINKGETNETKKQGNPEKLRLGYIYIESMIKSMKEQR